MPNPQQLYLIQFMPNPQQLYLIRLNSIKGQTNHQKKSAKWRFCSGEYRSRTDDLLHAMQAL